MNTENNNQRTNLRYCGNCGNSLLPDDKFCGNCGMQLIEAKAMLIQNETPPINSSPKILESPQTKRNINKKILIPIIAGASTLSIIFLFIFLTFTHIICINHSWNAPTCTEPAQCIYCDKYKNDILGNHKWTDATCISPRTCFWCDLEEGEPLGHQKKTTVTQQPTLVSSGTETVSCSICEEIFDSQAISKKVPKVTGASFNFTDDEFIDWINNKSTAEISHTEIDGFLIPAILILVIELRGMMGKAVH